MIVYVDLIFFLNFLIDLLLLITISIVLKRRVKIRRLFLGALFGSISLIFLFLKISSFTLFLFKIIIALLMLIISLGYKNIRYTLTNLLYLYLISIIYGGFVYFLNIEFAYKNNGLIFYNDGLSFNFIIILLISPIIIYIYIKSNRNINNYSNYYNVSIYYKDKIIKLMGYLDTGNNLCDPYFKRPIIIINKDIIDFGNDKYLLVSYNTIESSNLLKCYKPDKVIINKKVFKKILIAISNEKIIIDNIDCLLPNKIKERI